MPITVVSDPVRRRIVATAVGELTIEEFRDFFRSGRTGEERAWPLLFDATTASTAISVDQVRGLAANVGALLRNDGARAAVGIAAPDPAVYGVMRMYQILCGMEGVHAIHVFRTRTEADRWLSSEIVRTPEQG
jgi:hypothetical protein